MQSISGVRRPQTIAPTPAASADPASKPTPAVDAFEASPAPAFRKPNFKGVTAGMDQWQTLQLLHTVALGDTFESIAAKLGTDANTLREMNYRENPTELVVGEKLTLPTTFHVAKRGDTYWDLAHKTGLSTRALMALNGAKSDLISVGQELRVPAAVLSAQQATLRQRLLDVVTEAANAYAHLEFGDGTMHVYARGNDLGWWGPVEVSTSLTFSDDFDQVRLSIGEGDEAEPKPVAVKDPVAQSRKMLMNQQLRSLAWGLWAKLDTDPTAPLKDLKTEDLASGKTRYTVFGPADTVTTFTYDPTAETVTVVDNSGSTVLPATSAMQLTNAVAGRVNLTLPINPLERDA